MIMDRTLRSTLLYKQHTLPSMTTNEVYMDACTNVKDQSDLLGMFELVIGHRNQYANLVLTMTNSGYHAGMDIYRYPHHRAHPDY